MNTEKTTIEYKGRKIELKSSSSPARGSVQFNRPEHQNIDVWIDGRFRFSFGARAPRAVLLSKIHKLIDAQEANANGTQFFVS
jgi:hypothetical protein